MTMFTDIIQDFLQMREWIMDQNEPNSVQALMELTNDTISILVSKGMTTDLASAAIIGAIQGHDRMYDETAQETDFWKDKKALGRSIN